MKRLVVLTAFGLLALCTGCVPLQTISLEPTPIPTLIPATLPPEVMAFSSPAPAPTAAKATEPTTPPASFAGLPLSAARNELFAASGVCTACHTRLTDASGADVSHDSLWRSTLLANAARDPYWQASVRKEVVRNPSYGDTIQDKCATCHTPLARSTVATQGAKGRVLDEGFLNPQNTGHDLAMDGVSCTLCHQIEATKLGQPDTFSGGYIIAPQPPTGQRPAYGPFVAEPAQAALMQAASGFTPVQGLHVKRSELCAVCHNLYTPTIDQNGQIVGEFPEQALHLEWQHSGYRESRSCQDCHLPAAQGAVSLSITGSEPRSPVLKHTFVGGNVYMLDILRLFGTELAVTASSEQIEATRQRTLEQLQNRAATVAIENARLSDGQITADVVVKSQTGHKLPSGFPSRRAWLHVTVRDSNGQPVWESGAVRADGFIQGNDHDADASQHEPHYEAINSPEQVQIYEAIMHDAQGNVTTTLLRGAGYIKDNRLLPDGFDKTTAPDDIAVQGQAKSDSDFIGGSDRVRYVAEVGHATGPFTLEVELLYQTIGYRWAQNIGDDDTAEGARFLTYYRSTPNAGVRLATASVQVGH